MHNPLQTTLEITLIYSQLFYTAYTGDTGKNDTYCRSRLKHSSITTSSTSLALYIVLLCILLFVLFTICISASGTVYHLSCLSLSGQ